MNYVLTKEELSRLLLDSEILHRLQNGGVDNWDWYYEALSLEGEYDIDEWEEKELPTFLEKFPTINN